MMWQEATAMVLEKRINTVEYLSSGMGLFLYKEIKIAFNNGDIRCILSRNGYSMQAFFLNYGRPIAYNNQKMSINDKLKLLTYDIITSAFPADVKNLIRNNVNRYYIDHYKDDL